MSYFAWVSTDFGATVFPLHPLGGRRYKKVSTVFKKYCHAIENDENLCQHITHFFIMQQVSEYKTVCHAAYRVNRRDYHPDRANKYVGEYNIAGEMQIVRGINNNLIYVEPDQVTKEISESKLFSLMKTHFDFRVRTNALFALLQQHEMEPYSGGLFDDGITGSLTWYVYDPAPLAPEIEKPSLFRKRVEKLPFIHNVVFEGRRYMLGLFDICFSLDSDVKPDIR